ncbi:MAG: dolichyl-phosphate-mannose--protein O-mannosyl transferase [Enterobacterales bacterium]|jgi:dolichyl-phosphate-mannose--protein O-mannosyl transferase
MSNKKLFIYSSLLSYIFLVAGIGLFAIPTILEHNATLSSFSSPYLNKYIIQIIFACIVFAFFLGWLSVFTGKNILCRQCKGSMLVKNRFGFRGLALKPVFSVINNKQICSHCTNDANCEEI